MGPGRHRRKKPWSRVVARAVLVLGFVLVLGGISDFAYRAQIHALCSDTNSDVLSSKSWFKPDPLDCIEDSPTADTRLQVDALIVLVGILLLIGAGVTLSRAQHRTKRAVLATELAVLILTVVYSLLWFFTVYLERTRSIQR